MPTALTDEILFLADHTCCICRTKDKDVQMHHIDGDNSNNTAFNLAVVCLDCHSKVTGDRRLGRSCSRGESLSATTASMKGPTEGTAREPSGPRAQAYRAATTL